MSKKLQNFIKFQKFQVENLVDFEKCCKTHILLQKSEPIQPKTSDILPKTSDILPTKVGLPACPGRPPTKVGLPAQDALLGRINNLEYVHDRQYE